jgi:hypothetical protein
MKAEGLWFLPTNHVGLKKFFTPHKDGVYLFYNIPTKTQKKKFLTRLIYYPKQHSRKWSNSWWYYHRSYDGSELRVPSKMNTIYGDTAKPSTATTIGEKNIKVLVIKTSQISL